MRTAGASLHVIEPSSLAKKPMPHDWHVAWPGSGWTEPALQRVHAYEPLEAAMVP